jgi:hypothetical protein
MQAAKDVVDRLKELKINALHIKLRAMGGTLSFLAIKVSILVSLAPVPKPPLELWLVSA